MTVLVIEDEPTVRMLVVEVLMEMGLTPLEAPDGAGDLEILRSNSMIDLLVSDVGLPGAMNGREVADAARVVRPTLKVLFMTGYAKNAVLTQGHLEPGMHVLTKPFAIADLERRIEYICCGTRKIRYANLAAAAHVLRRSRCTGFIATAPSSRRQWHGCLTNRSLTDKSNVEAAVKLPSRRDALKFTHGYGRAAVAVTSIP